jgi:hypothetical protein
MCSALSLFCCHIDIAVSNLFLTTFFLFWILFLALQVLGVSVYVIRVCLAESCGRCLCYNKFGPVQRKEHMWYVLHLTDFSSTQTHELLI